MRFRQQHSCDRDGLRAIEVNVRTSVFITKDDTDVLRLTVEVPGQLGLAQPKHWPPFENWFLVTAGNWDGVEPSLHPPAGVLKWSHAAFCLASSLSSAGGSRGVSLDEMRRQLHHAI